MRNFIVTWRQCSPHVVGAVDHWETFEDVFQAVNLPLAVAAWERKCYCNAEIIAVQLVDHR